MKYVAIYLLLLVAGVVGGLPVVIISAACLGWLIRDLEQTLRDLDFPSPRRR